eukprot:UN04484
MAQTTQKRQNIPSTNSNSSIQSLCSAANGLPKGYIDITRLETLSNHTQKPSILPNGKIYNQNSLLHTITVQTLPPSLLLNTPYQQNTSQISSSSSSSFSQQQQQQQTKQYSMFTIDMLYWPYLPAYILADCLLEREGRLSKTISSEGEQMKCLTCSFFQNGKINQTHEQQQQQQQSQPQLILPVKNQALHHSRYIITSSQQDNNNENNDNNSNNDNLYQLTIQQIQQDQRLIPTDPVPVDYKL